MKLSLIALTAASLVSSALANVNAFIAPGPTDVLTAGQPFVVKWNNTDGGNQVNLLLKKGDSNNLDTVLTIAKNIDNGGAVRWAVPANLPTGDDYALEIQESDDPEAVNYTNQFRIEGDSSAAASVTGSSSATAAGNSTASATSSSSAASSSAVSTTSANISGNVTTAASTSSAAVTTSAASNLTTSASGHGHATKTKVTTAATGSASASGSASGTEAAASSSSSTSGANFFGVNALVVAAGLGAALLAL
ncbi:hypothetical protein TRVA0_018S01332 [Trichomonascus vanleenenianus]|uniref:GPI anchored serine-threonine rich family protein n=1 Tax=Trichomonascus vanleenenianus TaxID=2268995 RepID=UPI003ECA7DD9